MAALIPLTTPQQASGTELDLLTTGSPSRQTTEMPPRTQKTLSFTNNIVVSSVNKNKAGLTV